MANVPDKLLIEAKLSLAFCPLAALTPTENALGGFNVMPELLVLIVQECPFVSFSDAEIYGPPFGPPVGFHVS